MLKANVIVNRVVLFFYHKCTYEKSGLWSNMDYMKKLCATCQLISLIVSMSVNHGTLMQIG